MIDTLDFAERLRAGGFTEQQAKAAAGAFGHALSQQFVTKPDLDRAVADLRTELHKEMRELAWKMAGLLLAQGGAVVALIKLLP